MLNSFLDSLIENGDLYTEALGETAAMVGYSLFFSTIIGLFLGVCLVVLRPNHIY
jgi:D-methionine transport system permease protein